MSLENPYGIGIYKTPTYTRGQKFTHEDYNDHLYNQMCGRSGPKYI